MIQAWEILGLAMERDMDYEHASECYEKVSEYIVFLLFMMHANNLISNYKQAWKLEFEASAPVGFKLAFSLLKCRKFIRSIDVCEQVMRFQL